MNTPDMSGMTEMGGGTMGGMMKPWLHFTLGDNLFFMAWVPLSHGAVAGACIGLFILAIVERYLAAMRAVMEVHWARKTHDILASRFTVLPDDSAISSDNKKGPDAEVESLHTTPQRPGSRSFSALRKTAPFVLPHELARGALQACQAALGYTLMLAVMTFHAGYIIAIVVGLGVGEVLFGRFGAVAHHH